MIDKQLTYSMSCDMCGRMFESYENECATLFPTRTDLREAAMEEGWAILDDPDTYRHLCPECFRKHYFDINGVMPD